MLKIFELKILHVQYTKVGIDTLANAREKMGMLTHTRELRDADREDR